MNNGSATPTVPVRQAAVFDLDGTIRRSKSGGFIDGPEDVELFPGVESDLHDLQEVGFLIFGVTNQGGVAFGHKTVEQVSEEIDAMCELFDEDPFARAFASPFHPKGDTEPYNFRSLFRKPNYGMLAHIEMCSYKNGVVIDWDGSLMVGDRPEDRKCAEAADIDFYWAWDFFGRPVPDDQNDQENTR